MDFLGEGGGVGQIPPIGLKGPPAPPKPFHLMKVEQLHFCDIFYYNGNIIFPCVADP